MFFSLRIMKTLFGFYQSMQVRLRLNGLVQSADDVFPCWNTLKLRKEAECGNTCDSDYLGKWFNKTDNSRIKLLVHLAKN